MHKASYALFALPLLLLGSIAQAQTAGTITFTANQTTATGSLTPVLTWSTSPVASSCAASGGWSGTKFASGSETLPTITANASYTLTCTWGGGSATLNWTAPTKNTDGTTLTDLAGYKVLYGTSSTALTNVTSINDPKVTSTTIPALGQGTWYFTMRAVNTKGVESDNGAIQTKSITGASTAKTVNITINAPTQPPTTPPPTSTLKTIGTRVYDVVWVNNVRSRGTQVGTIATGKPCDSTYRVGSTSYYAVNPADVKFTRTYKSAHVVAKCAKS